MSYDDNGQLVRREKYADGGDGFANGEEGGGGVPVEVTTYEWNDQGMLVKVILPTGEPVEYEYDGNQRLISRKSSDGVDNFVQSGWDIVTKMDDVGKRTYYTGMSAVSGAGASSGSSAVESEDSVKYFHYNHRGDTVLVTDAEGSILNNFSYEAYGKPTNNEGIPINPLTLKNATAPTSGSNNLPNLFVVASGIKYDTKTDLHYMRFRWFSGEQMRFISSDLLMDLNRYAYVSGNPVNKIDTKGLWEEETVISILRNYGGEYSKLWADRLELAFREGKVRIKDKKGKPISESNINICVVSNEKAYIDTYLKGRQVALKYPKIMEEGGRSKHDLEIPLVYNDALAAILLISELAHAYYYEYYSTKNGLPGAKGYEKAVDIDSEVYSWTQMMIVYTELTEGNKRLPKEEFEKNIGIPTFKNEFESCKIKYKKKKSKIINPDFYKTLTGYSDETIKKGNEKQTGYLKLFFRLNGMWNMDKSRDIFTKEVREIYDKIYSDESYR